MSTILKAKTHLVSKILRLSNDLKDLDNTLGGIVDKPTVDRVKRGTIKEREMFIYLLNLVENDTK